jgi:hypothetical protein
LKQKKTKTPTCKSFDVVTAAVKYDKQDQQKLQWPSCWIFWLQDIVISILRGFIKPGVMETITTVSLVKDFDPTGRTLRVTYSKYDKQDQQGKAAFNEN